MSVTTSYAFFCPKHPKVRLDDTNFCSIGHLVPKPQQVRKIVQGEGEMPPSKPQEKKEDPHLWVPPVQPPAEPDIMKPRRFVDDAGRVMILRIKNAPAAGGWVIHCRLFELKESTLPKKPKLKLAQSGVVRTYGDSQNTCKTEFLEVIAGCKRGGWRDAPAKSSVKLMAIPAAKSR